MVVELLDSKEFFGVRGYGALTLVQMKIGVALARKPLLGPALNKREQAVAPLQVALLFDHIHDFEDALQALALPVGAFAFFQHHAPGIALVGFHHVAQLAAARSFGHCWPKRYEAVIDRAGFERIGGDELDRAAYGVVGGDRQRSDRSIVVPVVRIQA